MSHRTEEIAAAAAQLVVDEGMEYGAARGKAARQVAGRSVRPGEMPRNDEVEAAVRSLLATFHADTQPVELAALRRLAERWMDRLAAYRPHLGGAVWRGTATRRSAVMLDLYCDDSKAAEVDLINQGIDYDASGDQDDLQVLTLAAPCPELGENITLHLLVHDLDDLRGALKPDAQGETWRGDLAALRRRMAADAAAGEAP